jgi:hypothetical protein
MSVVGACMGGGYAVSVGARDTRVKVVASVAGGYHIGAPTWSDKTTAASFG